jgi:hypothetical protein
MRYKCSVTTQRRCLSGSKGDHVEKTCESCNCYTFPGVKGRSCFDQKGNEVEGASFPFLSVEECSASCKDEACIPVGKLSTYACRCMDSEPCVGSDSFKKNCNCIACYCEKIGEFGEKICKDDQGVTIPDGESICTQSLLQCVRSCKDSECPTTTKWGCLEAEGVGCVGTPEKERITECVELGCKEVDGSEECIPLTNNIILGDVSTNAKLISANFNTREECEKDRRSPFGSCKSRLCANSSTHIIGVSNTAASLFHAVPPSNLGVRTTNILNVDSLSSSRDLVGRYIDHLEDESIYNINFNFASQGFYRKPDKLVFNVDYPDIFNNYISIVVEYFLHDRRDQGWDEMYINELLSNKDHVIQSLNPDLNLIFNNLTYPTGRKVDPNDLYSGIIELLLTDSMDEFDPSYFKTLYDNQSDEEIREYKKSNDTLTNDNIALGIIADSLVSADPLKHTDEYRHYDFMANTKAFHTDVKAEVPITLESGDTVPLEIGELGIDVCAVDGETSIIDMGEGYGYYFPITVGDVSYPLEPNTQLSAAYFTPIDALDQAISLLGEDSSIKISASSAGVDEYGEEFPSEFESDFSIPTSTDFTYFALDLSAGIRSKTSSDNHIINKLTCFYKVITNSDEAISHSIEAGTMVTEVFLHYNDPLRTYLKDSGRCKLDLINIDFHAFVDGKAPIAGEIIVRGNIPRALVFIPAVGSKYNPFHAKSRIESVFHDTAGILRVSRSCDFMPYLEQGPPTDIRYASTRKFTYDEYKTYGRGLLGTKSENHPLGVFDVDSSFFTYELSGKQEYENLFYSNASGYTSGVPEIVLPPTTKLVAGVIDDLKSKYEYTHFTYWDIFRRLKFSDYAALQAEMNEEIIKALEHGVVTGDTLISMVLSGRNESNTGIRHPNDNTKYLTEDERLSLLSDGTITEDITYLSDSDRGYSGD